MRMSWTPAAICASPILGSMTLETHSRVYRRRRSNGSAPAPMIQRDEAVDEFPSDWRVELSDVALRAVTANLWCRLSSFICVAECSSSLSQRVTAGTDVGMQKGLHRNRIAIKAAIRIRISSSQVAPHSICFFSSCSRFSASSGLRRSRSVSLMRSTIFCDSGVKMVNCIGPGSARFVVRQMA